MTTATIILNDYFETKKSTVSDTAAMIQKSAKLYLGDAEFSSAK